MAEVDPVILQLKAEMDKYLSDVRRTTTSVDQLLDRQAKSAKRLESEMKRSSDAISGHLKGIAGTLATYFTGQQLMGLLDSFTRFQNQLRVAGLEGDKLKAVQDRLFASAQKYGVELEGLGGLFGKVTQSQKELGVSQGQILALADSTAAALKITGVSSAQSAGAILGLTQAFSSGKVKAEEYNQILEGGLQPLLQAAANSERFGGSLGKLRQAVVDGKLSSQEFFALILKGSADLETKAAKAALTLSGGFTALTNALTVYFGEADKANGVSAALGIALGKVADNLGILIPAIALLATAWGGAYVASAVRATLATSALTAAQIGVAGAAGTAGVAAGRAGAAMLAAFGGPVGAAIFAIGAALYYVSVKTGEVDKATGIYARSVTESEKASEKAREAAERLANAHGKTRKEALAAAQAERENTKQKLAGAKASLVLAQAELKEARAFRAAQNQASFGSTGLPGTATFIQGTGDKKVAQARANVSAEERAIANFEGAIKDLTAAINAAAPPSVGTAPGAGTKPSGSSGGGGGPSAADVQRRFNDELANYAQQAISAQASMARTAEERADLELRSLELARIRTLDGIKAEQDYSAAQKAILAQQVERLAELERERIEREKTARLEQEAQQLADEQYRVDQDALRLQFDMADTQADRKRIALAMLDLEYRYQTSLLEAVLASEVASAAEKQRAQLALDGLRQIQSARIENTSRQNETRSERYVRDLNKSSGQINEALDDIKIDGLEALNDGLVDAITGARSLGDVFKNVANQIVADLLRIAIQQTIIRPLAESLFGGFGGGGIFSSIGGLFGFARASGGYVAPGQAVRVNEGARPGRVEGFMSRDGGQIIPLGKMDAMRAGSGQQGGGMAVVRLELSSDIDARIQRVSGPVAVEVVRAAAPQIVDLSARETMARAGRPKL